MKPQAKRSVRRLWLLLLLILGLPAAYVLSLGPVVLIWQTFDLSAQTPIGSSIAALYRPLERLPEDSPLKKALDLYVHLWVPAPKHYAK